MRGRYFRYLFENPEDGLLHTGSIYDKESQKVTHFVYMAGNRSPNGQKSGGFKLQIKENSLPDEIDLFVVGSYSARQLGLLLEILTGHKIGMAVLPYLAPIQRLVLLEELKEIDSAWKRAAGFLQDPYGFLKRCRIETIYFLAGNGSALRKNPEELNHAVYFEQTDAKCFWTIREMEGYAIPIVRAGYAVKNSFLFYFGVYGLDIHILSDFTKDYFSHIENIPKTSDNASEDYASQMKRLVAGFLRKFGSSPVTTVLMFAEPLYASPLENASYMSEQEYAAGKSSMAGSDCRREENVSCVVRCSYDRDHDMLKRHKKSGEEPRFGVLLLGNANLNRYLPEIIARFLDVLPRVRAVTVPNSGNGEEWNHSILKFLLAKDRIYWICTKQAITSAGVISDIVLSSPSSRFIPVGRNQGCCLAGYIIPKEDID